MADASVIGTVVVIVVYTGAVVSIPIPIHLLTLFRSAVKAAVRSIPDAQLPLLQ